MKTLYLTWICISLAVVILFDVTLDFTGYMQQASTNMPNWFEFFSEMESLYEGWNDVLGDGVFTASDILQGILAIGASILAIAYYPIKFVYYVVLTLIALFPNFQPISL